MLGWSKSGFVTIDGGSIASALGGGLRLILYHEFSLRTEVIWVMCDSG